ncbi:ER membrane protein complex subunit 8-like isoform X1 [Portunus trituberculatus]|uniref:ER membrane protein complex subunit 8-like isoform X1 n=2 Tax=Portunus trituberculatus TaxID=210409 RepID=UPI001E1CE13F|nr:ER membrane protein complex subunit 8-like isoform X1 [Portunus trituberculatus]
MKVKGPRMSADISLSCAALAKILLHAARYPQTAVSGVVLAPARSGGGGDTGAPSTVTLVDAVPLFHLNLSLAPMLEVALTQIEQWYKAEGLVIAGYYQANENIKDNLPDFVALKVAEKIAENNNDACLIMIDNSRLCLDLLSAPVIVSQLTSEGKWKSKDRSSVHVEPGALDVVSQLLQRRVQHDVCDFDNHLDDLTCDWANPQINKLLTTLSAAAQD